LPQAVCLQTRLEAERSAARNASLTLDVNDGLESMTRQIVETALRLDGGDKGKAAARLGISLRTVQRYVASGAARAF